MTALRYTLRLMASMVRELPYDIAAALDNITVRLAHQANKPIPEGVRRRAAARRDRKS